MLLLDPKGLIAADEKSIMLTAVYLMLVVVIPVIVLTLVFAWRYRASNTKAIYQPDWSHSTLIEIVCWSVPCIIIAILGTITWRSTHTLDPYRPLEIGNKEPVVIQVIALDWKWLFIYPKEQIASVNFVQFPVNTPVKFLVTSEAAMNSFLIPQLAGQIYAMAGMQATLHLAANTTGDYLGFSANFSGNGFSDMHFTARASSQAEFDSWVASVKHQITPSLSYENYKALAKPTSRHPVTYYSSVDTKLFSTVVMQNMMPMNYQCHSLTKTS
jgi:cytochrome o ubiquinol oxidase subunit 2